MIDLNNILEGGNNKSENINKNDMTKDNDILLDMLNLDFVGDSYDNNNNNNDTISNLDEVSNSFCSEFSNPVLPRADTIDTMERSGSMDVSNIVDQFDLNSYIIDATETDEDRSLQNVYKVDATINKTITPKVNKDQMTSPNNGDSCVRTAQKGNATIEANNVAKSNIITPPPTLKKRKSNPFYSPSLKIQKLVQRKNGKNMNNKNSNNDNNNNGNNNNGNNNINNGNNNTNIFKNNHARSPLSQRSVNILQPYLRKSQNKD